jgi:addiction module RelE/StbE family toxin
MRIEWSEPARDDLRGIQDYIAKDSPTRARQFIEKLVSTVDRLIQFPESGRRVPEDTALNVRELIFKDYRIIYRPELPERVLIVAVVHGHRDLAQKEPHRWKSD